MKDLLENNGARFSECGQYRYRLWRIWDEERRPLVFCMLNPSTADAETDDPTVARCRERARRLGYGGVVIVNLFALRSTDPKALYGHADPVGPHNNAHISNSCTWGDFVCAWGVHGKLHGRDKAVMRLLSEHQVEPLALRVTKQGQPSHPLYLPYDLNPEPFGMAA